MAAVVAIIGRPNVGKSTLFNSIIGERRAIECDTAGTTRDSLTALHEGKKVDFLLVDTGGLEFDEQDNSIEEDTQTQARIAAKEADLIIFCVNIKEDITKNDQLAAQFLRENANGKPIFLVGTKADGGEDETFFPEIFTLGIDSQSLHFISATQNRGVKNMLDTLDKYLGDQGYGKRYIRSEEDLSPPRISFFGRPNAGKSSLINSILQKQECIVSEVAGTTRDRKDSELQWNHKLYTLIDTAGIRKRSKIDDPIEKYAMMRSFQAITESDVVVYVIDAEVGITAQDQKLIGELKELKTGVIIVINKWDLREKGEEAQKRFLGYINRKVPYLPWAPVVFTSAMERKNVMKMFPMIDDIVLERAKKFTTGELNGFLQEVIQLHPPAGLKNTRPRMKYMTQVGINPPHFKIFGSKLDFLHFSYVRYMEHRIRDAFGFEGTGVKIEYKNSGTNPYDPQGGKKNMWARNKGRYSDE
jgi:GTP-binding protein